jgi:hypothetical protein
MIPLLIIQLILTVVVFAGWWATFEKAGKPGWAAIIPIYNLVVYLQITGKPGWWVILLFIPLVNLFWIYLIIILPFELATRFGKSAGFGAGLLFLPFIFFPILGFGDAKYRGSRQLDYDDEYGGMDEEEYKARARERARRRKQQEFDEGYDR